MKIYQVRHTVHCNQIQLPLVPIPSLQARIFLVRVHPLTACTHLLGAGPSPHCRYPSLHSMYSSLVDICMFTNHMRDSKTADVHDNQSIKSYIYKVNKLMSSLWPATQPGWLTGHGKTALSRFKPNDMPVTYSTLWLFIFSSNSTVLVGTLHDLSTKIKAL